MFGLRMDVAGRVAVVEMHTMQALPEVSLAEILGNLLTLLPSPAYTPPSVGRSVWDRLRDEWPPPDAQPPAEMPPDGISAAEWETFVRWDPMAEDATGNGAKQ
jgi:hypothetical protein